MKSSSELCLLAVGSALLLTGCASITRGTTEDVTVQSEPADAKITTSLGQNCPKSPCVVKVARKTPFTAYAEREGYQPGQLYIDTQISGGGAAGMGGNLLIGGIVGVAIDASSGAMFDHFPNPARIVLLPLDQANPTAPTAKGPIPSGTPRKPSPTS